MPTIVAVQTQTYRLPMRGALSWGQAGHLSELRHVLVRLVLDTGHVGLAEAPPRPTIYGETPASIHAIIHNHLAPLVLGLDAEDGAAYAAALSTVANNQTARGALDIARYDALAAWRGQSLRQALGCRLERVRVSYILGIADLETMLAEARTVYESGVRVLKVKVGRDFAADRRVLGALQAEFAGTDLSLYGDANEGLSPGQALLQLTQLKQLGLLYIEEPLPVRLLMDRAALRANSPLPLIADDSAFSPADLDRELGFNTFDILNIKPARTGITESVAMLNTARELGKGVMIGSQASSTLGTARAAMVAGLTGVDHPSELSFCLKLEADIVNRPLQFEAGYLTLSSLDEIQLDEGLLAEVGEPRRESRV